jgi:hypothetical protein
VLLLLCVCILPELTPLTHQHGTQAPGGALIVAGSQRGYGGTKAGNHNRLTKCFVDKMDENPIGTTRTFPVQVHEPG